MLARAAARYAAGARPFLVSAPRPSPVALRLARDSSHRATKKSSNFASGPGVVKPKPQKPAAPSPDAAEFNPAASPDKNTAPRSAPGPAAAAAAAAGGASKTASDSTDYSTSQPEFDSPQSSEANTTPGDAPEPAQPRQPLPDLRQGIPSTFAAEFLKPTSAAKEEAPDPSINITEDPNAEAPESGSGRGGGGELPKSAYETSTDRRRNMAANAAMAMAAVTGIIGLFYLGREWETEEEAKAHADAPAGLTPSAMYARAKARMGGSMSYYTDPVSPKLLPDMTPVPPYTLVVSLEDMLIHSEWTREHGWRFAKRPGVDYFIRYLSQYFELVIFTSLPMSTAEPVIRKLDPFRIAMWSLFREATRYEKGEYVKDLSCLNRDLSKIILVDTKKEHAKMQPDNAIILPAWTGQKGDKGLVGLIPFLEYIATMGITDVRAAIKSFEGKDIATEFAARERKAREAFHKQLEEEKARKPKRSGMSFLTGALGMKPVPGQGGLVVGEESVAEGFEKGKMLSDQMRERGLKQYEFMEKEIRENGEKWLKEMAEEEKKLQEESMKSMKSGFFSMFSGPKPEGQ
ncbi:uncharacterized protein K452DRAFT_277423 [Aplosporella prunicola CBS 121167]|uniref:Mitochondrial import inner membrane translocase subunit TIM50 n=1 Tax=Aplosporella prunicola CBS 121167 TaxID=1176127 RepID=A0A6A6B4X9_9PEZI|nr:uncharacterized protein K452DRAFT_277423 [Aplosporella prunicola CBS 121167]KAF2138325.1 hypothetical protein K452DRAFT_277423 [Aplosporella prunicola CBS 121167]